MQSRDNSGDGHVLYGATQTGFLEERAGGICERLDWDETMATAHTQS